MKGRDQSKGMIESASRQALIDLAIDSARTQLGRNRERLYQQHALKTVFLGRGPVSVRR